MRKVIFPRRGRVDKAKVVIAFHRFVISWRMAMEADGLIQVTFGRLGETHQSPRYRWDNRKRGTRPFVIVQQTERGAGVFEFEGRAYAVPAGHAFIALVPEDSRYFFPEGAEEAWRFSWLNFYGELALRLWGSWRDQAGPVTAFPTGLQQRFRRLAARAARQDWRDRYEASRAGYAFYLEAVRCVPRARKGRPFAEAIAYFRAHYQEPIRITEGAGRAGMSREHFTRRFAAELGQGPAAYLREIRLKAAARLLRTTALPVAETAFRCGWGSATKLDYFFKRRFGVSPRGWRRREGA
jgi:AraC-like DNA-binding protein